MDEIPKHGAFPPDMIRLRGHVIDLNKEEVRKENGDKCELRPQAFALLKYLALNTERVVTKEELLAQVWRGTLVTDDSLVQAIGDIRRALNDTQHSIIKTVPRRGYMLVDADATLSLSTEPDASAADAAQESPPEPDAQKQDPSLPSRQNRQDMHHGSVAIVARIFGFSRNTVYRALSPPYRKVTLLLITGITIAVIAISAAIVFHSNTAATLNERQFPSIAVLPFKGMPSEIGGEELARDVAAELASELARSPEVRVISIQSSFRFAVGKAPLSEIGRRLHARYLVDGSVRRDEERLRIAVQLLDSQSEQVMWSLAQTVDRTTLNAVPQVLVSRIAGTLQSKMAYFEERRAITHPPKTLDVVVLTARAKALMLRYSPEAVREARHLLQQALSIDPDYAPAWAVLGVTNTIDFGLHLTGEITRDRAQEVLFQVRHAVPLRPDMPKAYAALSDAEGMFGNFDAALAAAQQCLRLSPNDDLCFYVLGLAQLRMGQINLAIQTFEQSIDRNPLPHAALPAFYATALWASGRLEDALRVADECLAKAPDFWRCRQERIAALIELGRKEQAREEAERLRAQHPEMTSRQFKLLWAPAAAKYGERRATAAREVGFP